MTDFTFNPKLTTQLDPVVSPLVLPAAITSGTVPQLALADGIARGQAIVGRCRLNDVLLGLKVAQPTEALEVVLKVSTDDATPKWWGKGKTDQRYKWSKARVFSVISQGRLVGALMLKGYFSSAELRYRLQPDELDDDGLLMIEIIPQSDSALRVMEDPLAGVRIDSIIVGTVSGAQSAAQFSGASPNTFWGEYALVVPGPKAEWVSLELTEKPPLAGFARYNRATRLAARILRKAGVLTRRGLRRVIPGAAIDEVVKHLTVELFDIDNQPVEVIWRPTKLGLDVKIPAGTEPLSLRVALPPENWRRLGYSKYAVWRFLDR